jgi:hypothetical protein
MELKWFVYILRFYDFGVLARARRILTPTVEGTNDTRVDALSRKAKL